jgi:hypothetical protein
MGAYLVHGNCFRCGRVFSFNPHKVPSIPVKRNAEGQYEAVPPELGGVREPVCRPCVDEVNPVRVAKGLDPIRILPGAYEPADEFEEPLV